MRWRKGRWRRRLRGPGRGRDRRPAACRPPGRIAGRRHRRARGRVRARRSEPDAAGAAQSRLHHRRAHRRARSTACCGGGTARPIDPATVALAVPRRLSRRVAEPADRHRAAAGRARPPGTDRDRRGVRHHRDGRERPDQHGGGRAGQPDRARDRDPAGLPAAIRSPTARPSWCRAPTSRSTTSPATA